MAKLTKDEFNTKYADKIKDNDELLIEIMEDFADSVEVDTSELDSVKQELESAKNKYSELQAKYKERFLSVVEDIKEENSEDGLSEKEFIDIQEI